MVMDGEKNMEGMCGYVQYNNNDGVCTCACLFICIYIYMYVCVCYIFVHFHNAKLRRPDT